MSPPWFCGGDISLYETFSPMRTHDLNPATEPFEAIKNGAKSIEFRLYNKKRQAVNLGDEIVFTNREAPDQVVKAKVIGLLRYHSFKELFSRNGYGRFGGSSDDWLINQIHEFYSA